MRYYKTRSMATDACKKGHVTLNEVTVKPGKEVQVGDEIAVRINQVNFELTVLGIPKSRVGAKLVDDYRKDTTPQSVLDHIEMVKMARDHHRKKGMGRPTKKERRDIEGFFDDVS